LVCYNAPRTYAFGSRPPTYASRCPSRRLSFGLFNDKSHSFGINAAAIPKVRRGDSSPRKYFGDDLATSLSAPFAISRRAARSALFKIQSCDYFIAIVATSDTSAIAICVIPLGDHRFRARFTPRDKTLAYDFVIGGVEWLLHQRISLFLTIFFSVTCTSCTSGDPFQKA